MADETKIEFAVRMTCKECVSAVKKSLENTKGIKIIDINLSNESVIVETNLPSATVKDIIESSGREAVIRGVGSINHMGAAVAIMEGGPVAGVLRMVQTKPESCIIEGTLDGLEQGKHRVYVHEYGDISDGCKSCGDVFDFGVKNSDKALGDIGTFEANERGRASFRFENKDIKVWDMIGRSMVVHSSKTHDISGSENNSEDRMACGIIARSAGLFQNTKKICACDGVTIWDERNVPIAGAGRRKAASNL